MILLDTCSVLNTDSLNNVAAFALASSGNFSLDVAYKIAMICIAFFNLILSIYIFAFKNKVEQYDKAKRFQRDKMENLILKYKLAVFYSVFETINTKLSSLKSHRFTKEERSDMQTILDAQFIELRLKFVEFLGAVDEQLYNEVLAVCDFLLEDLTKSLADEGINLDVEEMYSIKIEEPIIDAQRKILKTLYTFGKD